MKMKTFTTKAVLSLVLLVAGSGTSRSQYLDDGLRLGAPSASVGARSLGMGTAYTALSNDYSGMYWNPAGLGLMQTNEFQVGLSNLSFNNTATYYGNETTGKNSGTSLNSAGFVYNVPTSRGSLVIALGYGRTNQFTSELNFSGFNPSSSIIQSWAPDGAVLTPQPTIAEYLLLAYADTTTGRFVSPIGDSLTQSGKTSEGGGLNHWSFAGSVEAAHNIYLGLSLNYIAGSYRYNRKYYEDDLNNIYPVARYPYDVATVSYAEDVNTDINGFSMKFGFLANPTPHIRLGLTVKTPNWVTQHETFSSVGTSAFKNGDNFSYSSSPSTNDYSVATPWVFTGGLSFDLWFLTVSGDIDYTDWTQLSYSSSYAYSSTFENYLNDLNQQAKDFLRPTANLRGGAELNLQSISTSLRAGFMYFPSPYNFDTQVNAQKYLTAGIGFLFEGAVALDFAYAYGWWETSHVMYSGYDKNNAYFSSSTSEKVHTDNVIATFTYRF
jgi:hypothetical protein